jgi:3-oxoacyl-[acyl-carrier protein] reductase
VNLKIKNRTALIIGASKNIGRNISITLAKEKVSLIMVARSKEKLTKLKIEVDKYSTNNLIIQSDLSIKGNINKLINKINKKYKKIDIIVHNLGGSLGVKDPFSPSSKWLKVWNINLGYSIDINNFFIPKMIHNKWGRIVHISSAITTSFDGYSPYASAKCALEGYIKSVSKVVSKNNVILSGIAPGLIDKEEGYFNYLKNNNMSELKKYYKNKLPINRMCTQTELSNTVTFLCSDLSSYLPGVIIKQDGVGN